jgi:hypothetical protein
LRNSRLFAFLWMTAYLLSACGVQASPTLAPTSTTRPTATFTAVPTPTERVPVGTDIKVDLPQGDLERGETIARMKSCIHCHVDAIATRFESGDDMPRMTERGELRIADPAYNGSATSGGEYILESILLPEIYIVPGTPAGAKMPTNFDQLLTKQDLADLLVWLKTFE